MSETLGGLKASLKRIERKKGEVDSGACDSACLEPVSFGGSIWGDIRTTRAWTNGEDRRLADSEAEGEGVVMRIQMKICDHASRRRLMRLSRPVAPFC